MSRDASNLLLREIPELTEYQVIGRNVRPLGSSVFLLEIAYSKLHLKAQLPCKFNDLVFFGKNKFCIATLPYTRADLGIDGGREPSTPDKRFEDVLAVIDAVLTEKSISELSQRGEWPEKFASFVPSLSSAKQEPRPDDQPVESNRKKNVIVESSSSELYY